MAAPDAEAAAMHLKFFFGACMFTGALLLPHSAAIPVVAGMVLAGVIQWAWFYGRRGHE